MANMSPFCVITVITAIIFGGNIVVGYDFTHHESLDEEGKFHLLWKFDDEKIEFEAQVQTTGWVGLGLSPNGGMPGSDIAIGWVKDGTAYLTDRYAEAKAQPSVDESQDWELVSGYENGTHTVLRFNRKLTTCDVRDRVINEDTLRVLWAWHDQDPEEESGVNGPTYHGTNRGARATLLLNRKLTETPTTATTTHPPIVMTMRRPYTTCTLQLLRPPCQTTMMMTATQGRRRQGTLQKWCRKTIRLPRWSLATKTLSLTG